MLLPARSRPCERATCFAGDTRSTIRPVRGPHGGPRGKRYARVAAALHSRCGVPAARRIRRGPPGAPCAAWRVPFACSPDVPSACRGPRWWLVRLSDDSGFGSGCDRAQAGVLRPCECGIAVEHGFGLGLRGDDQLAVEQVRRRATAAGDTRHRQERCDDAQRSPRGGLPGEGDCALSRSWRRCCCRSGSRRDRSPA